MSKGDYIRIPSLFLVTVVGIFELLFRSGSFEILLDVVVVVFSVFRIAVDFPTIEWGLGWLVLFLGTLTFANSLYIPNQNAPIAWTITLAGGAVTSGLLIEQSIGAFGSGYLVPPVDFSYDLTTAFAIVVISLILLFVISSRWAFSGGTEHGDSKFTRTGFVTRSLLICLSTGLMLALINPLTPLPELLFIISGFTLLPAQLSGSDNARNFIDENVMKSVTTLWGGLSDLIFWVYTFSIISVMTGIASALEPLYQWSENMSNLPELYPFILATVLTPVCYVLFYVGRLNQRAHRRLSSSRDLDRNDYPKRLPGLLLPIPATFVLFRRTFSETAYPSEIPTDSIILAVVIVVFMIVVIIEGVCHVSIFPRIGVEDILEWIKGQEHASIGTMDKHVFPISVAVAVYLSVLAYVGDLDVFYTEPLRAILSSVLVCGMIMFPYLVFIFIENAFTSDP